MPLSDRSKHFDDAFWQPEKEAEKDREAAGEYDRSRFPNADQAPSNVEMHDYSQRHRMFNEFISALQKLGTKNEPIDFDPTRDDRPAAQRETTGDH